MFCLKAFQDLSWCGIQFPLPFFSKFVFFIYISFFFFLICLFVCFLAIDMVLCPYLISKYIPYPIGAATKSLRSTIFPKFNVHQQYKGTWNHIVFVCFQFNLLQHKLFRKLRFSNNSISMSQCLKFWWNNACMMCFFFFLLLLLLFLLNIDRIELPSYSTYPVCVWK